MIIDTFFLKFEFSNVYPQVCFYLTIITNLLQNCPDERLLQQRCQFVPLILKRKICSCRKWKGCYSTALFCFAKELETELNEYHFLTFLLFNLLQVQRGNFISMSHISLSCRQHNQPGCSLEQFGHRSSSHTRFLFRCQAGSGLS